MTFKFKHTLAVILAVVTVACSVVGTLAVSAAETDSQPATEATVASDVTDTSVGTNSGNRAFTAGNGAARNSYGFSDSAG